MRLGRLLSRGISETVSVTRRTSPPAEGFRILIYHAVGTKIGEDRRGIYTISPGLFEWQMNALVSYPGKLANSLTSSGDKYELILPFTKEVEIKTVNGILYFMRIGAAI